MYNFCSLKVFVFYLLHCCILCNSNCTPIDELILIFEMFNIINVIEAFETDVISSELNECATKIIEQLSLKIA